VSSNFEVQRKYLKKYGFLKGYSSAFSILGTTMLSFPDMSDEKEKGKTALSSDWRVVGGDLYKAISLIDDEFSN
jgi:hypothetical protein